MAGLAAISLKFCFGDINNTELTLPHVCHHIIQIYSASVSAGSCLVNLFIIYSTYSIV